MIKIDSLPHIQNVPPNINELVDLNLNLVPADPFCVSMACLHQFAPVCTNLLLLRC